MSKDLLPAITTLEEAGILTQTRLKLPPNITYEQYEQLGEALAKVKRGSSWWLGDWLLFGDNATFSEKVEQAASATGLAPETLRHYLWVCKSIPPSRRLASVPFSVHALVAPLEPEEQKQWLSIARAEDLTQRDLRFRLREAQVLVGRSTPEKAKPLIEGREGRHGTAAQLPNGQTSDAAPVASSGVPATLPTSYVVPGPIVRKLVEEAKDARDGWVKVPRELIERLRPIVG